MVIIYMNKYIKNMNIVTFNDFINENINEISEIYNKYLSDINFQRKINAILLKNGFLIHSTSANFDSFDEAKIKGGSRAVYGYGIYFSSQLYKFEEYGLEADKFQYVKGNIFNFLDINDKFSGDILNKIKYLNTFNDNINIQIERLENMLYNVRNNREYDMINNEIEDLKDEYKNFPAIIKTICELIIYIHDKNKSYTINNVNKTIINQYNIKDKEVSEFYKYLGYDGFAAEPEHIIFNISKLNENLVKDKKQLIYNAYLKLN